MSQKINFMLTMLLVLLFAGAGFAEIKTQQPRYGNGTKDAPFKITSVAELYWLAEVVNGGKCSEYGGGNCSAELTTVLTVNSNLLGENNANVNAETGEYTGNAPANVWTPIGTKDNQYTGTFDGNGKIVRGLYFNDGTKDYVGLFGYISPGATVQNVGVVDSYFKGKQYVGGVVGYNNGGTISNAYNTGFVSGTQKVGGVVGQNDGTISNVYNTGSVSGEYNVGGVVGRNNGVTISNAYNTGSVSGNDYVGGVVGDNGGPISNAYNTGSVSGNGYVGGVVGYLYKGMFGAIIWDGSISNVYNTGSVSGTDGCVGGVAGSSVNGTVSNAYNTGSVSGNDYVGGVVGDNGGPISNAYNTGSVSGTRDCVGGVVGYNYDGTISNVYNTGSVSGTRDYVGGVVGKKDNGDINNAYYDEQTCNNCNSYGTGKPLAELASLKIGSKADNDADFPLLEGEEESPWAKGIYYDKATGKLANSNLPYLKSLPKPQDVEMEFNVKDNVIQISSTDDLKNFAKLVNEYHITDVDAELTTNLTVNSNLLGENNANVNAKTGEYKGSAPANVWTPIGTKDNQYTGTFDGKGNTVSGLYFNDKSKDYVGLFGYISSGATVQNVGVIDSYIKGKNSVGGVVGDNDGGAIINVYNAGSVSGTRDYVGGVVGQNDGTISNVYNTGSVSGEYNVGGVVGINNLGSISNAYNTGSVSGDLTHVGGVVGDNKGTIGNVYNTGSVSGISYVGGVVGDNENGGKISNVYNTGSVSGISYVGGVVGDNENGGKISNVYNTGSVSGTYGVGGVVGGNNGGDINKAYYDNQTCNNCNSYGTGKPLAELASLKIGSKADNDADFPLLEGEKESPWAKGIYYDKATGKLANSELPYLKSLPKPQDVEMEFNVKDNVIQISSTDDLKNFAKLVNVYHITDVDAELTTNLTVNSNLLGENNANVDAETGEYTGNTPANVWTPIGTSEKPYTGTFDGNGYTIRGLYFNDEDTNYVGLFGYIDESAKVQNVGVVDSYFKGKFYVGGVVGENNNGTVSNVYNTGSVSGSGFDVGGVVGKNDNGIVSNAYNTGSVSGDSEVGGVVGFNVDGSVSNVYNTGSVSGNFGVGGVVGNNYGTVSNVYNTGIVSGLFYVGGVVGFNYYGTVSNVYNTGVVSGNSEVGGVVGQNDGTVSNVYNTGSVSGNSEVGGMVGYNNNGTVSNGFFNTAYYSGNAIGESEGTADNVKGLSMTELASLKIGSKADNDADFPVLDVESESPWVSGSAEATKESESDENYVVAVKLPKLKGFDYQPMYKGTFSIKVKDKDYTTPELTTDDIESISLTFGGKTYNDKNDNLVLFENNDPDNFSTARGSYYGVNFSVELLVFAPIDGIYVIEDAKHLKMFAKVIARDPNANGILANDIVFNDGSVYDVEGKLKESLESWTPMGTTEKPFTGRFNAVEDGGAAHTISGMYFNNAEKDSVGLFKKIGAAGSVANVGIVKSYIKGNNYVGAIAGLNEGSISASFNSSTVEGGSNVGGVAGGNAGEISNVYNAGPVSGASEVGGVVGNNGGSVNDVYSIGAVSGTGSKVGGAIGGNVGGTISGVYYDMDMPCTNCSDVAGVSGKYSAELADYGFVNSAFSNASSVWSAGSFMNNNGKLSFKLPYLTGFGAGTQPTFTGSFAVSAKNKSVYKSKNFTAGDIYSASFSVGTESFKNDAEGFVFSSLNDLTESGMVDGTYHGVNFSLLMDPIIVVDGDKATIHGDSKQTLNIAEEDGFTINGTVTVKRNFTENGFSTVMFPFSMKASSISGATFYELSNVAMVEGKWRVSVSEVKDTETEDGMVKANTPYLVKTANASELVLDEGEYKFESTKGVLHSVESNGWNLVGTYGYKKWEEGDDGIGKTYGFAGAKDNSTAQIGKFGKIGAGAYIYPMRVYLEKKAASGVRSANGGKALDAIATLPESIDIVVDGGADKGTTVIGTLNSRTGEFKAANDGYFDTKGRSVGKKPAAKGSYYNKKKAVAK